MTDTLTSQVGLTPAPDAQRDAGDTRSGTMRTEAHPNAALRRVFTEAEDRIVRLHGNGFMRRADAMRTIHCGSAIFTRRLKELGFTIKAPGRTKPPRSTREPLTIPADAGDPSPAVPGRTTGRALPACVSSLNCPAAGQTAAGTSSKGGRAHGGGAHRRVFNEAEREIIRQAAHGEMPREEARHKLSTNHRTLVAAMAEFGATAKTYQPRGCAKAAKVATREPDAPKGWFPIAHGNNGKWREYDGSPVTIEEARAQVAAGLATMAQKRIDGGFDLLFRAVRA